MLFVPLFLQSISAKRNVLPVSLIFGLGSTFRNIKRKHRAAPTIQVPVVLNPLIVTTVSGFAQLYPTSFSLVAGILMLKNNVYKKAGVLHQPPPYPGPPLEREGVWCLAVRWFCPKSMKSSSLTQCRTDCRCHRCRRSAYEFAQLMTVVEQPTLGNACVGIGQ
jgi:hypothetical protein